jgi:hypothetical protein
VLMVPHRGGQSDEAVVQKAFGFGDSGFGNALLQALGVELFANVGSKRQSFLAQVGGGLLRRQMRQENAACRASQERQDISDLEGHRDPPRAIDLENNGRPAIAAQA